MSILLAGSGNHISENKKLLAFAAKPDVLSILRDIVYFPERMAQLQLTRRARVASG
jgi:hypothetical protein